MLQKFLQKIRQQARENPQKIVFPEGCEERVLKAVHQIYQEEIAWPVLLGNPDVIKIKADAVTPGLTTLLNAEKIPIINPEKDTRVKTYAQELYRLRKHKDITEKTAAELIHKVNYFGTMMVYMDEVDGMISGTTWPTADTILPALQIIKTKELFHKVSGFFFMVLEERLLLFADCAVTIDPNSHDLADIAIDTAETAKRFGIEPRIAMLSFSTNGSAKHPSADKVKEATAMVKFHHPELKIDGEMQVDAALVPEVASRKYPASSVPGNANILIFPDLEAANISYKLVERLAGAQAIGPILQGLKKPVNDLSRGCKYEDIVNLAAITTIEAQELDYPKQYVPSCSQ